MRISVIMPVFNCSIYLERAVNSLLATKYPDLEIVVVDDGSDDGTWDVAQEVARSHPGCVTAYFHIARAHLGVSASRNLGIERSSGELIAFLDGDDYVYPHRFQTAVTLLANDPLIDGVYELAEMVFATDSCQGRWDSDRLFGLTQAIQPGELLRVLLRGLPWATSAILFRRSLLKRTGLFHESLRYGEDCHLWFRMACVGTIVPGNLERPVSAYFRHAGNTYRPCLELRREMVWAMADVWRWGRRSGVEKAKRAVLLRGLREYLVNAVVVAREAGRASLALDFLKAAVVAGGFSVLLNAKVLRQSLYALRDAVGERSSGAIGQRTAVGGRKVGD